MGASKKATSDKRQGDELKSVIINACYIIGAVSNFLEPFLPETAGKIREQISFEGSIIEIKKGGNLFPRLE